MTAAQIKKIAVVGPPGTGKTTYLTKVYNSIIHGSTDERISNELSDYLENCNTTLFITFTTTARDVLQNRGVSSSFTLHSFVTRLLINKKLISASQIQSNAFESLMLRKNYGYDFIDENSDHPSNAAKRAYYYYFNKYPHKTTQEILQIAKQELKSNVFERMKAYVEYVEEKNIIDYVTVLRIFIDNADYIKIEEDDKVDVMIVDEAQDLSELQFQTVIKLAEILKVKVLILAGDYNQSIYDFQGADYRIFKNYVDNADKVIILDKSYRLPQHVHSYTQTITMKMGTKVDFQAKEEKGKLIFKRFTRKSVYKQLDDFVDFITDIVNKNLDKKIFILMRTNKQVRVFEKKLFEKGIATHRIKSSKSYYEIVSEFYNYKENRIVSEFLIRYLLTKDELFAQLVARMNVSVRALVKLINNDDELAKEAIDYLDTIVDLMSEEFEQFEKVHDADVYLDTMHSAKGEEADLVIVVDLFNARVEKAIKKSQEALMAEMRLFYVATTRTRDTLIIITTESKRSLVPLLKL